MNANGGENNKKDILKVFIILQIIKMLKRAFLCTHLQQNYYYLLNLSPVIKLWLGIQLVMPLFFRFPQIRRAVKCESILFKAVPCCGQRRTPDVETFKKLESFFEEESKEQFKETWSGVQCRLLWCVFIKLSGRHVQTHTCTHSNSCFCTCLCLFFPSFFISAGWIFI